MKYFLTTILNLIFLGKDQNTGNESKIFSFKYNAQHLKKDSSPDMHYKANKSTYSSPSYTPSASSYHSYPVPSYSGTHLKKDGTPDLRYKENKSKYSKPTYATPKSQIKSYTYYPVKRDKNGKIIRSESAKHDFLKQTGYPHERP